MENNLKEKAIKMRRNGLSYSEILQQISIAKSTLSLWLHSVSLSKKQKQRLTDKKLAAAKRGALTKKMQRIETTRKIFEETKKDIKNLNDNALWLAGIMLYWAEGSKEKSYNIGQRMIFTNSDPKMIKLFLKWLTKIIRIPKQDIQFEIYIHETGNVKRAINFWSKIVVCDKDKLVVYFKKNKIKKTNRKNINDDYFGTLRIVVKKSSSLNRKISAWIYHICKYWGVD